MRGSRALGPFPERSASETPVVIESVYLKENSGYYLSLLSLQSFLQLRVLISDHAWPRPLSEFYDPYSSVDTGAITDTMHKQTHLTDVPYATRTT